MRGFRSACCIVSSAIELTSTGTWALEVTRLQRFARRTSRRDLKIWIPVASGVVFSRTWDGFESFGRTPGTGEPRRPSVLNSPELESLHLAWPQPSSPTRELGD